ncbi:MAG: hypothetical protein IPM82_07930 [Saprospiraceae bacterium]|nr:hypothetical protein [Saprospiraceae bacterium]
MRWHSALFQKNATSGGIIPANGNQSQAMKGSIAQSCGLVAARQGANTSFMRFRRLAQCLNFAASIFHLKYRPRISFSSIKLKQSK